MEELLMARFPFNEKQLTDFHDFASQWGKIVCRRAFGEDGPGLDVDLTTMETVAVAAVRGLLAGILEEATSQQARQLGSHCPCPDCQQSCIVTSEPRQLVIRNGTFLYNEPVCHCTRCRRDFFPFKAGAAVARVRL
jgi:cytochrome c-type biogenesis protein CcmH/NrfF